jgi:imidazolonepropionase-like amidohydrolase
MTRFALVCLFGLIALQAERQPIAIVDVTVVPMDRERLLEHQTVVIQGDRITAIGTVRSIRFSETAQQIDGRGKFLMPGLADMHVHFVREALPESPQPASVDAAVPRSGIPASASREHVLENRAYALMFLANGVTTVRNMWGSETIDALAKEIHSGRLPGPHVYSTGPITDGNPPSWESSRIVENPEQAEAAVRQDKLNGRVAIKVYGRLSTIAYTAIVAAAKRQGLPVVGHVPTSVGLAGAIAARQDSIEHWDAFIAALSPDVSGSGKPTFAEIVQHPDLNKLPAFVQAIWAADLWVCPTLVVSDNPRSDRVGQERASFVPPDVFVRYAKMYPNRGVDPRSTAEGRALSLSILSGLHRGGAHLLLGTDTMKVGTLPGYSLHDELKYFVTAGMTPYEAIKAGTADAAKFLRQEHEFGRVATGLRADLLLVDANPLTDVQNVSKIAGVFAGGRWLASEELKRQLLALRAGYQP